MQQQTVTKASLLATSGAVIAAFTAGVMTPSKAAATYDHSDCIRDCIETCNDCNLNCWGDPDCVNNCQWVSAGCELDCDSLFSDC
jgi:hypothetical protein